MKILGSHLIPELKRPFLLFVSTGFRTPYKKYTKRVLILFLISLLLLSAQEHVGPFQKSRWQSRVFPGNNR